jgi:hypothetical protein
LINFGYSTELRKKVFNPAHFLAMRTTPDIGSRESMWQKFSASAFRTIRHYARRMRTWPASMMKTKPNVWG